MRGTDQPRQGSTALAWSVPRTRVALNGKDTARLQNGVAQTLTWDHENHLSTITGAGVNDSFLYDADGQRVRKISNGVITYYPNQFYETYAGNVDKYYYFNGRPVAVRRNGTRYYLHQDQLGNLALVTSGGARVDDQGFYAYGRLRRGIIGVERSFTGQQKDFSSGLIYMKARYYDPKLGQFLSPDTLVPDPTVLIDYNRYAYARLNPLRYNDPSGHSSIDKHCLCGGGGSLASLEATEAALEEARAIFKAHEVSGLSADVAAVETATMAEAEVGAVTLNNSAAVGEVSISASGSIGGQTSTLAEAAQAEASLAQMKTPTKLRPGAAGALEVDGEIFTAQSVKGGEQPKLNPEVQEILDGIDPALQSDSHGFCVEPQCISQALDAGVDPRGGTSYVVNVRTVGNPLHGLPKPACSSCEVLLQYYGITDGTR